MLAIVNPMTDRVDTRAGLHRHPIARLAAISQ
jgi:hypothetical protein